tara:strand:- start:127 stop:657 length:531 start_codon:yes stop_codon:yes gene_type:complete
MKKKEKNVSKIFIQENFFPLTTYNEIVHQMLEVAYFPPDKDKIEEYQGSYWHTHTLPNQCDVQKQIAILIAKKFNFNVSTFKESSYTMVGASDKPRPHTDKDIKTTHQCLIYMYGEESTNNGTGFYHEKSKNKHELSIHVGFKQNRAIFFSSDVWHSPLQWAGNGSFRYSICNFFT